MNRRKKGNQILKARAKKANAKLAPKNKPRYISKAERAKLAEEAAKDPKLQFSINEDKPADWFEPLYAKANIDGEGVPWANMSTQPLFKHWLEANELQGKDKSALVVGCGLGDDAIELEQRGFSVTAFDVSETAINLCKKRFPESKVEFIQADLLAELSQWHKAFDFVLEIYTVQALPPKYEAQLIDNIAAFVAEGGHLLVIAEVSNEERQFENGPPWLLTPEHVDAFCHRGLSVEQRLDNDGALEAKAGSYITLFKAQAL